MSLVDRLNQDMKLAMKNKDKLKLSVIRMVKSAIKNAEINQGTPLTDEQVLAVVTRELKQRRDSLQEFEKAGREDLAAPTRDEINILLEYMPEQMGEDEIRRLVSEAIQQVSAQSKKRYWKSNGCLNA
jgi:uncharacterized protein YqeY